MLLERVGQFNYSTPRKMSIVTVKNKFQVVIPQGVREEIGIAIGDILEARAERGRVVFVPKAVIDRGIAQSMAEFESGRAQGPFESHAEFIKALHERRKKKPAERKATKRSKG
jgi:AbrB family looped-hinge helix DNA binding protein